MKPTSVFRNTLFATMGKWLFSMHSFLVFNFYLRLKIIGRENLPKEPFIICSNHQSHLDAVILGYIGTHDFTKSALIAAKDYWYDHKTRYFWASHFFNVLPIDRYENSGDFGIKSAIQTTKLFFKGKGKCVAILPEGTRHNGKQIRPFKDGIKLLAKSCKVPVVPVYIHNSGKIWPKGKSFFKPARLEVWIGLPLHFDKLETPMIREKVVELSKM